MRWILLLSSLLIFVPTTSTVAEPVAAPQAEAQHKPVATPRELIHLGSAMADMKRWDEAITAYTLALEQEPENGEALADRALAYAWTNRLREATDDLAAAEKLLPDAAVLHRIRAVLADRRSDLDTELAELTKSLLIEPDNSMALAFRATIYEERQQYDAALVDAEGFIRARPDEPYAYQMKARLLEAQRKWPLAIEQAELLRKRFANDPRALASAAEIYRDYGKRADALEIINHAIRLDEGFYYLWRVRATIRPRSDFGGRRLDLDEALGLAPGDLSIITQLGLLEFDQHNWASAFARFSQILDKEPRDFGVLAYRAMARLNQRDADGARKEYEAALAASSGPDDLSMICWAFATEGMALEWATTTCDRAVAANAKKARYRDNRGLVRLRLGNLDGAIADYDQAIASNPNDASAYYGRAIAYSRKNSRIQAQKDRDEALAISPTVAEAFVFHGIADLERARAKAPAPRP